MSKRKHTRSTNLDMSTGQKEQVVINLLGLLHALFMKTSDPVAKNMLKAMRFDLVADENGASEKYMDAYDLVSEALKEKDA